jgi:serine/threonine protein kinase
MSMEASAKDLFARAHELSGEQREAFLNEACGDNAELRLEVQRLLVLAEKADSFFGDSQKATILADDFDDSYAESEGDRIGPYVLRQRIGEGGFGVVWMAEQTEPISRRVALKVVKAGMDTREVLARFEAERQALAMMDHPNIAKVFDAGATASGRPFFAMELVRGIPITRFCNDQKYGPRPRLELFKDVCSAVNHAHQKGIIHRDLKPSNVMVTLAADKPVVKVIDFGVAKATHSKLTEKTLFTRFEQFVGTPVYMSPEQAAMSSLDVDVRSDIYSLGVLLYELLAGSPPFDQKSLLSAGYEEMRRIIREDEPPRPSTKLTQIQSEPDAAPGGRAAFYVTATSLKGELDWIVMKAIEKDRTRRYETASAFASDIDRYLADEPVEAAAPSAAYRFKKFARRNKIALGVAAAMVLLLLAGIAATSWQAVRATAEKQRAVEAEGIAEQRLLESEAAREDAQAVSEFLVGMFESSRPGEKLGGRGVKVADVLDRAAKKLETDLAGQPGRRAYLQAVLGHTYHALGLNHKAIELQEEALEFYREELDNDHSAVVGAMNNLAVLYREAGRPDEALGMREQVLALRRKALGTEHPRTLTAMNNLANSYHDAGRFEEALELGEQVVALRRKLHGAEHPDTLMAMINLASSYRAVGRRSEALELGGRLVTLCRKVLGVEHPETLRAMGNLANLLHAEGRQDEALEMRKEVLALKGKVLGPEHPGTLQAMINLAISHRAAGNVDEAMASGERVVALSSRVLDPEHPVTLKAMNNLANVYHEAGRRNEALALCEKVLELRRKVLGPEHPDTLLAMENLALSFSVAGRREEALAMQEDVLRLSRKLLGAEHRETLGAMTNLAGSYREAGRLDEAIELQEQALASKRRTLPPDDPYLGVAMRNLAACYEDAGRGGEAAALRQEMAAPKQDLQPD